MDNDFPFVSVIIPTYHDWERLKLCINALKNQTYPGKFFEVIIVNNDPEDIPYHLDLPSNCSLISEAKKGSYAARNQGITIARGEILAFTDSDCIPSPNWIEQAVNILLEGAKRIAGRIELFYKSEKLTLAEIYEKLFAFDQENNALRGGAFTANMITWKKFFNNIGYFNESLTSGGDNEWGWRAQDSGIKIVYAPSVVVQHPARNTLRELLAKQKRVIKGTADIEHFGYKYGQLTGLFRELRPPLKSYIRILAHNNLSLSEKIMGVLTLNYIKLYRIYLRVRFLINNKPL